MTERNSRPTIDGAPRRATSIRLDTALLAQAKAASINPGEVLELELLRLLKVGGKAAAGKGFGKRKK